MKKLILLFFLIINLFSLCYAEPSYYYKSGNNITIVTYCHDNGAICDGCNVTVSYPDNTIYIDNAVMLQSSYRFNYSAPVPSVLGTYTQQSNCCHNGNCSIALDSFEVNTIGTNERPSNIEIYIGIFFFLLCIVFGVWGSVLPSNNKFGMGVDGNKLIEIEYGKYLKVLFFFFSYIFFWITTWLLWSYAHNYILNDVAVSILYWAFLIESIIISPVSFVIFTIMMIKYGLTDTDILKWQKRGLLPR